MEQPAPTVYVVDDDLQARDSLQALLISLGLDVRTFASAEQFLSEVSGECHGCVLADFRLTGMNGLQFYEALRAGGQQLPVILVSAYFSVRIAITALDQGVFCVLEKPFTQEELEQAVRRALEAERVSFSRRVYHRDLEHRLGSLDDRQRMALRLIISGQPTKAIERHLGVSRRTVERTRATILRKTNTASFVELAAALAQVQPPIGSCVSPVK
jgi:FixJ family two-component response regulator